MINAPLFTIDRNKEITNDIVATFINRHLKNEVPRLNKLNDYYDGKSIVDEREKDKTLANNIVKTNYAAYISDFDSAYLVGEPIGYSSDKDNLDALKQMLDKMDAKTQDSDLALDASIFGMAYDMLYMSGEEEEKATVKAARLSPLNAFVVYDTSVEQKPVFAVYYYPVRSEDGTTILRYEGQYCTAEKIFEFTMTQFLNGLTVTKETNHYFGDVPINEIFNNGRRTGDFEPVISLTDGYNVLMSDRVNDKEQFVDSMLVITGATFGDTDDERDENYEKLRAKKVLELPMQGSSADFLTRQLDEQSVEVLRAAIVQDIHKISGVPDMSDQNFAANASGVAMKYKLLGLEQKTKTKERFFAEGMRIRLRMLANIIAAKGGAAIDVDAIEITFTRSLPANEQEIAQLVSLLAGKVPQEVLLAKVPGIDDVDAAIKKLDEEKEKAVKQQAAMFANTAAPNMNEE